MPRWEHGSKDRLVNAALELFDELGFEKTSIIEISERAGVSNHLRSVLIESILERADVGEPLKVVVGALSEFDWEKMGSRDFQRQRQAVIAANPELLERDLVKNHSIVLGFIDALRQRGVDVAIAEMSARVGTQLFFFAYLRWLEVGNQEGLATLSKNVMSRFASIVPTYAPSSLKKRAGRLVSGG